MESYRRGARCSSASVWTFVSYKLWHAGLSLPKETPRVFVFYSDWGAHRSIFQSIEIEPLKISDDLLLVDDVRKHGWLEVLIANAIKKVLEVLPGDIKDLLERL